jgi:hypothetical protein
MIGINEFSKTKYISDHFSYLFCFPTVLLRTTKQSIIYTTETKSTAAPEWSEKLGMVVRL